MDDQVLNIWCITKLHRKAPMAAKTMMDDLLSDLKMDTQHHEEEEEQEEEGEPQEEEEEQGDDEGDEAAPEVQKKPAGRFAKAKAMQNRNQL